MSHGNARLNLRGRVLLIERVVTQRRPVAHVREELGISRQCAHRWVTQVPDRRERGAGGSVVATASMPRRTPIEVEQRVLLLRRELRQGQDRLAPIVGVPARTVGAILRRHDVPRLAECDPLTGEVIRASKATARPL